METSQHGYVSADLNVPGTSQPVRSSLVTADHLQLPLYRWPTREAPRATVALIHGLAEHAGRYAPLAARLNEAGIELLAIDLRGHGEAPGKRAYVERFDDYLLDAQALHNAAAQSHLQTRMPLFLMGHSMGGAVAALHTIEQAAGPGGGLAEPGSRMKLSGLILSSPALAPGRDVPGWMLRLSQVISRLRPNFPAMKIDAALLSRVQSVVDANLSDPLVHHGPIPARTGAELLLAMARIERGRAQLRVPLLVYHGTADKLTEPQGSQAFAQHAGSPDKTLRLYEGSFHETMNDLDRDRVIGELIEWIEQHLRPAP